MNLVKLEQVYRARPWAMPECEDNTKQNSADRRERWFVPLKEL